jgi:leader peptidase (prepilin peptidase) / N-methyltransferase
MADYPLIILAALLGGAWGSFAALVIDRWPRGESLVRPPSRCEGCDRGLTMREMVPVVSWLALRGRCRTCGAAIGRTAPLVEASCAALAAGAVAVYGITWNAVAVLVLVLVLVPVVVIDLRHRLIPDVLVLPALIPAIAAAILADPSRWWIPVAGALGSASFLFLLWVAHPGGMGLGDVKLAALIGAVLGASAVPALFIAFAAGALLGVVLLARLGARARKVAVPFGPFLAAGALAALWVGPLLIDWYAGRFG